MPDRLERVFQLFAHGTTPRREVLAGITTFLTMGYIIFVQPAFLTGKAFNTQTGMDAGAVMTATCLTAALATAIMGLYARYPIALAPGMGLNAFFVTSAIPAAALAFGADRAWQVALGVVFVSGVLFLLITFTGLREKLLTALSPSMKNGIAVGIGLFIAFIGMKSGKLVQGDPGTLVKINTDFFSPDLGVFFFGLLLTAVLTVRRVRGAILWGIAGATLLAMLLGVVQLPSAVVSLPPSLAPTFFQMDVIGALSLTMLPYVVIFLIMDVFDTMGTLIGVGEQAGFIRDNKLPRANRAMLADATGTVAGACLGTSTVTSYIESTAGVEQGGRTGLVSVTVAILFLAALFFSPIISMIGNYLPITAPALVVVGSMMIRNVTKIDWSDYSEAFPVFLVILGIPLTYSIADGVALGLISYPIVKLAGGRAKDVHALMYVLAGVLVLYFWLRPAG